MLRHTNPWELDEALVDWGYGTGPCEAQDHVGLDVVLAGGTARSGPIQLRMVAEGRLGKKVGVGYYRYPGGGGAVIDPLVEDLIREEAWFAQVARSEMPPARLVAGMNAALVDVLAETGDAALDLLVGAVHFPRSRIAALRL